MSRLIDLTGRTFGRLFVFARADNVNGRAYWKCRCNCGNSTVVAASSLRRGNTKSCGCISREKENLIGRRFERLTVISESERRGRTLMWHCRCDCAKEVAVSGNDLRSGNTKSCGCLRVEMNTTHGVYDTRLYWIWHGMHRRCNDPKRRIYHRYGGRGIRVCAEWNDANKFYLWAIANGYQDGLQIDRIDNDGDYCPENCRWVTKKENANNTSQSVFIEYEGQRRTIAEWARITGVPHSTIKGRLIAGKPPEEIFKR